MLTSIQTLCIDWYFKYILCNVRNEQIFYFTTKNFTLLQKTLLNYRKLYYIKSIFFQILSKFKFLLAFEKWLYLL